MKLHCVMGTKRLTGKDKSFYNWTMTNAVKKQTRKRCQGWTMFGNWKHRISWLCRDTDELRLFRNRIISLQLKWHKTNITRCLLILEFVTKFIFIFCFEIKYSTTIISWALRWRNKENAINISNKLYNIEFDRGFCRFKRRPV